MASWRPESVGRFIQQELSELIRTKLRDPRLGFVTITSVSVPKDLRSARVHVSVMGDDDARAESMAALERAAPFLRRELGALMRIRHTPELFFRPDDSMERGARIDKILDGLKG
jgi:ribosome-binding factor A